MIIWPLALLVGIVVIAMLRMIGHPSVIDRGPEPGQSYPFWDDHSIGHLIGAMIVAVIVGIPDGWLIGFLVSMALWTLVEVAQKYPADGGRGYFSWADIAVDAIGAAIGAALCCVVL